MWAKTIRLAALGMITVPLVGCALVLLQPKTFQCSSVDWSFVRARGKQLAACQGMSREEFAREYERAKAGEPQEECRALIHGKPLLCRPVEPFLKHTTLEHLSENDYLVYEGCQVFRFRFEDNQLVEFGVAMFEGGWFYWSQPMAPCPSEETPP